MVFINFCYTPSHFDRQAPPLSLPVYFFALFAQDFLNVEKDGREQ